MKHRPFGSRSVVSCLVPLVALFLNGCDATGPQPVLTVSIRSMPAAAPLSLSSAMGTGSDLVASASEVTSAMLTLATFQLSESATCGAGDTPEAGCNEIEIQADPVMVDLALDGTTQTIFTVELPQGEYSRLQALLQRVEIGLTPPTTYESDLAEDIDLVLNPALSVTEGAVSFEILITVDPAGWFSDGAGGVLDSADPANAAAINENIKKSLNASEVENS